MPSQLEFPVMPAVLKWARATAGYTLQHAAQHIGRPPETLAAWEQGRGHPSWAVLRDLADFYRRPVAVFLLSTPPEDPKFPVDYRSPAAGRRLSPPTRLAVRRALRLQAIAGDISARPRRTRGRNGDASPEKLAARERRRLGVPLDEQFQWRSPFQAFRRWRASVETSGLLALQMSMPLDEVQGFSLAGNGGPPTIVVNSADDIRPRVFTLFHEYCHALFGDGGICLPESRLATVSSRGEERFCNDFAGAVLVPASAVLGDESAQRLASYREVPPEWLFDPLVAKFEVSRQVIWQRLYALGQIPADRFRAKWAAWRAIFEARPRPRREGGAPMAPPARTLNERGSRFVSLVLRAEGEGTISHAEALDYLGIRAQYFDSLASLASRSD